jgi:hypothetical protein
MDLSARLAARTLASMVSAALGAGYAVVVMAHADALRAAGVNGTPPPNAAAIRRFVAALADNALWLIGTIAVLAFVIVGGFFFIGHSRAPDYAARVAGGAFVVVIAPAAAA